MTIGSLFAGVGVLELGLEWAGVGHTVWQVESDPYCRSVLQTRWPNARRFDDVRDCTATNLPPIDLLCGGFPCQDISNAGKRAGIGGERSGLWSEFARIIRELGPRYVVVENVSALLVRGLDRVLGDLAAAGYDAEWDVLSAADVGAPHLRRRVFLIAWRADAAISGVESQRVPTERRQLLVHVDRLGANVADTERPERWTDAIARHDHDGQDAGRQEASGGFGERRQAVADSHVERGLVSAERRHAAVEVAGRDGGARRASPGDRWTIEPDVGRVAHGVPARVDRLRALGNAVVPQCAEVVGRRLLEIDAALRAEVA
jgi:DNA (cytosine-5)-methyltransferase 1